MSERVYFVDTSTERGLPPDFSIRVIVAIDPPLKRGISAREMTVSVNCTANTFTIAGLVSLDAALNQVSADPEPTDPAAVGGPFQGIRDYLCAGKMHASEALEAGLVLTLNPGAHQRLVLRSRDFASQQKQLSEVRTSQNARATDYQVRQERASVAR